MSTDAPGTRWPPGAGLAGARSSATEDRRSTTSRRRSCWVPDLDRWLSVVFERLAPGGTFFLAEHHPVWEALGAPDAAGRLSVVADYFGRRTPSGETLDRTRRPTGWSEDVEPSSFTWPVSDVVAAVARSGLRLESFSEHASPDLYEGLGTAAEWLPATYLIRATRP